jgi:RNA-binding protein YlmH
VFITVKKKEENKMETEFKFQLGDVVMLKDNYFKIIGAHLATFTEEKFYVVKIGNYRVEVTENCLLEVPTPENTKER